MVRKIWLVRFQLWFLCFTSVNYRQVERGFAEAGDITVSTSQRKIGKVVDLDGFGEVGFLGRKMMVRAFSREYGQDEGLMKNERRRISEENKDSQKFNARFEDHAINEVKQTRSKSKRSEEKPIVYARNTRGKEEDNEEEKLMEEAEKVAKLMHNDYREISHARAPVHNNQPRHLHET